MFSKIFSKKINIHDPNYFELDPILGNKSGVCDGEFKTHSKHFRLEKNINSMITSLCSLNLRNK